MNRRLNLSREPTYQDLLRLQKSKGSYTVVVRPSGYTARGMEVLYDTARELPRHRFVLVVEARSYRQGVVEQSGRLQKLRNVFIGYVGIEGKTPSFKKVREAYAELTRRATPSPSLEVETGEG